MAAHERLTLFFPMWNEEEMIERTVGAAKEIGEELDHRRARSPTTRSSSIDDASTDATGEIADRLAKDDDHLRVVHHPDEPQARRQHPHRPRGGVRATSCSTPTPTCPSTSPSSTRRCGWREIYDADIVSAYRHDRTGEGAKRARLLLRLQHARQARCSGSRIRDVNFAFKLIRRRVLDHLELQSGGSFIDVELLAKAQRMGFHIIQFGVDYFPAGPRHLHAVVTQGHRRDRPRVRLPLYCRHPPDPAGAAA